jgi:hypothetical protein
MPRPPPPEPETQVAIRIPDAWIEQADELARKQSLAGLRVSRTEILRVAMGYGLHDLTHGVSSLFKQPLTAKRKEAGK